MKNPALADPTDEDMDVILMKYAILKEIMPRKGVIDRKQKRITVNPAFNMQEILTHEALHYYYEDVLGVKMMERFIKNKARKMIKQKVILDLMNKHLDRAKVVPARNLFGMVG